MNLLLAQLSDETKEGLLNNVEKARDVQESFASFNPAFAIIIGVLLVVILTFSYFIISAINRILKFDKNKSTATDAKPVKVVESVKDATTETVIEAPTATAHNRAVPSNRLMDINRKKS